MNSGADFFGHSRFRTTPPAFWERIINDDQLEGCDDLEKLLAGCEIIAALDRVDLLDAA
ncbi:MAG TPA: hypothetical protein VGG94_08245 [Chthoniobacterales bacterium]|jgi:hypothetical protein